MAFVNSCKQSNEREEVEIYPIKVPSGAESSLPYLVSNAKGMLLSWVEKSRDSTIIFKYARLQNDVWSESKEIMRGDDWFVNWADFPIIAENNGNMFSHVLKKSSQGTYSYDVKLNVLPNEEENWINDLPLHTDSTTTEHGFVTALPYGKDSFFLTWLDGRNTGGEGHDGHSGAMTIRAAVVSSDGIVSNDTLLDDRTCDCCQTTAAITTNGPVVIYRDRSVNEVRDIAIVRKVNGIWTEPKIMHNDQWKIHGCPVNGPKAVALDNNLVVAWFTSANDRPTVKVIFSADGGENFDEPIEIESGNAMGRVDALLLDKENALISWMEKSEKGAQLKVVKVNKSGNKGAPIPIADLDASRTSGFPQMELVGDKVYFAWTNVNDTVVNIKMSYLVLESL